MKCPLCGEWSTVLETRGTRRRRECANQHRFNTVEQAIEDFADRNARIMLDPRGSAEVAKAHGLSLNRVIQIRRGGSPNRKTEKKVNEEEHRSAPVRQRADCVRNATG